MVARAGPGVLLASMPLSSPYYPNLALGLLEPLLRLAGFACKTRYFSLDYVQWAGLAPGDFDLLTQTAIYAAQAGEWAFAPAADPALDVNDVSFLTQILKRDFPKAFNATLVLALLTARAGALAFVERCYASVDWAPIGVLGLTSSFQQTTASLALARLVKERHPGIVVVMGGANCQEAMGAALLEGYPCLDAVCTGEGERALPALVQAVRDGMPYDGIPGIATRQTAATPPPRTELEALPYPDFDAFFDQRAALPATLAYPPAVVFETARGCWWGAKHHCTFCGLNGTSLAYRSKSQARAFAELDHLVTRHGCSDVANADNILDMAYFKQFLPKLAASHHNLLIYYETKANLRPDQIALLAQAGVRKIQAGIESLDSRLLTLMKKGTTALQNVQTLKWAAHYGVYVEWLGLYGFPGETADDYARTASLLPALSHLQPPAAFIRVRADRFSPYFDHPEAFGVTLEPLPAYEYIYRGDASLRARLGYHFTMHSAALDQAHTYTAATARLMAEWRAHQASNELWIDAGVVHDTRHGWPAGATALDPVEAILMDQAAHITPWKQLTGIPGVAEAAARLERRGWLVREGGAVLALPLPQPGFRRAPSIAEIRIAIGLELPQSPASGQAA